jgi:hypothetical protein
MKSIQARCTTMEKFPQFTHRVRADGSFDSICHKCFATVANEKQEESLFAKEDSHKCFNPKSTGER